MRKIKNILCTAIILLMTIPVAGKTGNDSLYFEILMSSQMLKSLKIEPDFISAIEVNSARHVMLASKSQFYLLGWGGIKPLGRPASGGAIRSFAFSPDSLLMVVKNDEVCYFDSKGMLSKLYKLPGREMALSYGKKVMYLYDQSTSKSNKAIYVLSPGGKYAVLLELTTPVNAVTESDSSLLFATRNMVCRFDIKTKDYKVIASLSKEKTIRSLTVDPSVNRIYFSTDRAIYAVNDSSAMIISESLGGILKFYDGGLMVFDPEKRFLVRIAGIEKDLATVKSDKAAEKQKPEPGILKNSNIVDLVISGTSDALIISIIKKSKVDFNLSIDSMVELSEHGVSSEIIMEMKQAVKRQASQNQNK